MRRLAWIMAVLLLAPFAAPGGARAARDELVIAMTQFPATFSPVIESMLAKAYVLAMTRRPLVTYDQRWELVCMLCTELPTIENGLARLEALPGGRTGMALTYTLQPGAMWGDGTPVTTRDVVFAW